ncbi:MAG: Chaperone SurA [Candidatus Anoxychlamydiales bacterium]|nr:Chaperone SurA [Candidatus Anoxychlamydiales bacterium]
MKIYKTFFLISTFSISLLFGSYNSMPMQQEPNLNINNTVLCVLNDKTISLMDVVNNLESSFKKAFPDLVNSNSARYQFYSSGWQQILNEIVNKELILQDAKSKELKITDLEVREEIEKKYGPNVVSNLEKYNLTFEEAFANAKDEMISQRMMWYYVQSKALLSVTPQVIRGAYRLYCEQNPKEEIYSYHMITIKSKESSNLKEIANDIYTLLETSKKDISELEDEIINKKTNKINVQFSKLYTVKDKDLVPFRKSILSNLEKNSFSKPVFQAVNQDKTYRIFYLKNYEKKLPPTFNEMASKLKDELLAKSMQEESDKYFKKLRKQYGINDNTFLTSKDYQPFTFQ